MGLHVEATGSSSSSPSPPPPPPLASAVGEAFSRRFSLPLQVMSSFASTYNESLREALQKSEFCFVLTDPRIHDNPIVYASDGFLDITGYTAEEVLGKNCRFLQGPATDRRTILEIRDAIREERSCQVSILNYTKQGHPFWNLFHLAPLYSAEDGTVIHFLGVQTPIGHQSVQDLVQCVCPTPHVTSGSYLGQTPPQLDEDECDVVQSDRDKAKSSVQRLMNELTNKCKGAGVSEFRHDAISAQPAVSSIICSSLMLSLTKVQQSFVLANPHLPDTPIVHASDNFLQLTGYSKEEVVGHNCRFLQGPDTDPGAVQQIRESLKAEKSCTVKLLNYRKDKTPFWNLLHIAPVRSSTGKVAFFVGVQLEVSLGEQQSPETGFVPDRKQLGAVGAVKVAVRSLQGEGLRRAQKSG